MSDTTNSTDLTLNQIKVLLAERVSGYNAKLLLNDAIVKSGVNSDLESPLNEENAKSVCMALINSGGPSFQVGKSIYQRFQ